MIMERLFQLLALVLAVAAAYFYWTDSRDALFASVVLGAVAFFLSIRFQIKERNRLRGAEAGQLQDATSVKDTTSYSANTDLKE
jgi:hypothetical protein